MAKVLVTEDGFYEGVFRKAGQSYDDGKAAPAKDRKAVEAKVKAAEQELEKADTDDKKAAANQKLADAQAELAALDA